MRIRIARRQLLDDLMAHDVPARINQWRCAPAACQSNRNGLGREVRSVKRGSTDPVDPAAQG